MMLNNMYFSHTETCQTQGRVLKLTIIIPKWQSQIEARMLNKIDGMDASYIKIAV